MYFLFLDKSGIYDNNLKHAKLCDHFVFTLAFASLPAVYCDCIKTPREIFQVVHRDYTMQFLLI